MRLNFYLHFHGQCEKAIKFYQSILGGEIKAMIKVAGSPAEEHFPPENKNDILHASLSVGDVDIMASDAPAAMYSKPQGAHICINLTDEKEATHIFNALSEGGKIIMPFEPTFFAKKYAMFADRFGTQWMIHCADEQMAQDCPA